MRKNSLAKSFPASYRQMLLLPVRFLFGLSKAVLLSVIGVLLLINVATVTITPAFSLASAAVEAIARAPSVRSKFFAEANALKQQNLDLEESNRRLRADNIRLETEVEKNRVTYRGQRHIAREAVSDTSTRVSRRVALASARNVASMAGEALPFVGVAVITAATAWELHDACEMMSDLHELDVAFNPDSAISGSEVCGMRVPTAAETWQGIVDSPGAVWEAMNRLYDGLPEITSLGATYDWLLRQGARFSEWLMGESSTSP